MEDKVVSSPGKWIHKAYGAVMLVVLAIVFLPAGMAGKELRQYCSGLATGTPVAEIRSQAEERGFNFNARDAGQAIIDDDHSMLRPQCQLSFDDQKLTSAIFVD